MNEQSFIDPDLSNRYGNLQIHDNLQSWIKRLMPSDNWSDTESPFKVLKHSFCKF